MSEEEENNFKEKVEILKGKLFDLFKNAETSVQESILAFVTMIADMDVAQAKETNNELKYLDLLTKTTSHVHEQVSAYFLKQSEEAEEPTEVKEEKKEEKDV